MCHIFPLMLQEFATEESQRYKVINLVIHVLMVLLIIKCHKGVQDFVDVHL